MKKLSVLILAAAALFAGCNNLTVEKNKDSKSGNVTINIANQSRTISPMSGVSLEKFEEWKITFKDQDGFIDEFSVNGTKDNLTFTVPAGIYTVTVESSYTPKTADGNDGTKLTLTGTRTDVEIGGYAEVNISVGLAKESKGNFSYTLPGYVSGYVSLVNINEDNLIYSAQIQLEETSEETSEEPALKAVMDEYEQVLVTGTGLKSGFYKLYVTDTPVVGVDNTGAVIYYNTDAVIYYDIGDFLVEIADGLTTTGSASSVSESQKQVVYYGTNETTDYNGKFPFAKKNVNDILQLLINNKKWQFATIYMEDVPVLDVVVINQLRKAMIAKDRSKSAEGYYYVRIITPAGDTLINLYATKEEASEEWKSEFSVDQVTELSLNADSADKYPDESKELVIDNDESDQNSINTLNLTDGVTVATSYVEVIAEKLTVNLDNYNTYEKTAFLVFTDVPEPRVINIDFANESYIAAQKTVSDDEAGPYTISWYARVACPSEVVANEAIPEFSITAEVENVTITGGTIPVAAGSTIKFYTLSEELDESYTYTWYLTGDSPTLLTTDPVYTVDPTRDESFPAEGTIACVVSDDKGNWGSAVFQFELTASQSPIILYNNETLDNDSRSQFAQGLAAFDDITDGPEIEKFLLEGAIRDFCFDGNVNLYAVTVNEKEDTSTIYKYTYSLLNGYSSDYDELSPDTQSLIKAISCDTTNGYLFTVSDSQITVFVPGDQGYANYTLDVPVDEIKADAYNLISETEGVTYTYETAITNIAVSNPALYIAMDVIQKDRDGAATKAEIIARYTYEKSGGSITLKWNSYEAVGKFKVFEDVSEYPVTVNDMMVQDSKLYVLVSQQVGTSGSLRHRGALLTITDDNGSLSLTSTYGANTANYAASALDEDEKTFYAPQKFLAVMPKKLVIADEGYWISDLDYPKDTGNSGFVNRVVTVDLSSSDYSSEAVNVNVSFDLSMSIGGSGPGEYFINY